MGNGTSSQRGKLKALCSVKQRGDEGKKRGKQQQRRNISERKRPPPLHLYGSQVISDQSLLMDSTGKFMKARIWCCNASRAAAMCYNVEVNGSGFLLTDAVFFITLLSLISPPARLLLQKLVSSVLSLFSPPTNTLCTSASGPFRHLVQLVRV